MSDGHELTEEERARLTVEQATARFVREVEESTAGDNGIAAAEAGVLAAKQNLEDARERCRERTKGNRQALDDLYAAVARETQKKEERERPEEARIQW